MSVQKKDVALRDVSAERRRRTLWRCDKAPPKGAERYVGCYNHLARACVLLMILIALLGACQVVMLVARGRGLDGFPPAWPTITMATLFVVAARVTIPYLAIRSLRKFVEREEYKVCLECGYLLKGLMSPSRCPECGTAYDIEETRAYWKSWLAGAAAA